MVDDVDNRSDDSNNNFSYVIHSGTIIVHD